MNQLARPQYYEGEYLSADDLAAIVRYARLGQARHALGAHLWGIAIGLELVERSLTGDDVEIVLTPGVAWDGHARGLVALAPQRLPLDRFANFQDDTVPQGIPVEVWLVYRELEARPPGVGFACPDDDLHGRAVETFEIELRRTPVTDSHTVAIASRSIAARNASTAFDAAKGPLFDESVPQQEFPDSGDRERWPIFVGIVRWLKSGGLPGKLIKRIDDDRNATRRGRRYLGAVAETVVAPDGVLRLRDRTKDPDDPIVNYKPPVVAAPAGTPVVNDLVWCEGHLRVVGDTRLQDGKLDYRVAQGGDDDVPIYLRRTLVNAPLKKTTLDAFIGPAFKPPPAPQPVPPHPQTRFTVSTGDPAVPTELLTVVTDKRVGINAAEPTNTLQVEGDTGIRYKLGYVTGDGAFTAFAFNAYTAGGPWVLATNPGPRPAALVLDAAGMKFQTSNAVNPPVWKEQVAIFGATGNVGIGTSAPLDRLHVSKDNHLNAVFDNTTSSDHLTLVVGTVGSGLRFSDSNEFFIASQPFANRADTTFGTEHLRIKANGSVGIGTATPQQKLHVVGDRIRLGTAAKRIDLRADGSAVDVHSETDSLYLRSSGAAGKNKVIINPFAGDGNVGIGTETPAAKLDVSGNMQLNGDAFVAGPFGIWTTSDRYEKEHVEPIRRPLQQLLALRGVTFSWRSAARDRAGAPKQIGFVAQDVEAVFPEWVKEAPSGKKAVNIAGMNALVVEAMRELVSRCDSLESEVAALRARLDKSAKGPTAAASGTTKRPRRSRKKQS